MLSRRAGGHALFLGAVEVVAVDRRLCRCCLGLDCDGLADLVVDAQGVDDLEVEDNEDAGNISCRSDCEYALTHFLPLMLFA